MAWKLGILDQLQFEYSNPTPGFHCCKVKGPVAKSIRLKVPPLEVTAGVELYNIVVDTDLEETGKSFCYRRAN